MARAGKVVQHILSAAILLLVGLLGLNLFLTDRLERYLTDELVRRTAEATDGFYRLSFDKLDISFFSGELRLEGVRLVPDSLLFRRWQAADSLPQTYVEARIGLIGFKGLNLTWRLDYKRLHFNSFEVSTPVVHIYNAYYSNRLPKKGRHVEEKTLYELISPYIDVLSVKRLDLEHASVSYTVENPATPIVYALTNVSFHAYGFRLDSASSAGGKLLYCDNFDFATNQPQTLLSNDYFRLHTDKIRLSTEDSVIFIRNIALEPQEAIWNHRKQKPDKYLSGRIDTIEVRGIRFERKEALSYLTARTFEVRSSDIKAFDFSANTSSKGQFKSLSLYEFISPVLHEVVVGRVAIERVKLDYSLAVKDSVEVYTVGNANFRGYDFRIDSLPRYRGDPGYFGRFEVEASAVAGGMTARGYGFRIAALTVDSEKKNLRFSGLALYPLSVQQEPAVSLQAASLALDSWALSGRSPLRFSFGRLDMAGVTGSYSFLRKDGLPVWLRLDTTNLSARGLSVDMEMRTYRVDSFRLNTRNIRIPLNDGFYNLAVGALAINQRQLRLNNVRLSSPYPKMKFAYAQPRHDDWFDVSVGSLVADSIGLLSYLSDKAPGRILHIGDVRIDGVMLQNFKNKQIDVEPRLVPMIYGALQKAPVRLAVDTLSVTDLHVVYEELAKNGTHPGKLFFTDMNGTFTGFTNVVSMPKQYIRLDASGLLMGTGGFTATWMLPVDSLNDRFLLDGRLSAFDLTALNDIITPLAPLEVEGGRLNELTFRMDASSKGGTIQMLFLYDDLKANILKEKDGEQVANRFASRLARLLLKEGNPDKKRKGEASPRTVDMYVERDPYHSTFNYLWQILRPAVAESVGISHKEQEIANKSMDLISRIKHLFGRGKKREIESEPLPDSDL